jgi:hypothetical protein
MFHPAEEQFDLPALFKEFGDGRRWERPLVGPKRHPPSVLYIKDTDAAQDFGLVA